MLFSHLLKHSLEVHIINCYVCKEKRPGFKELLSEQYAHQLCIIHQAEAGPQFIMSAGGNRGLTAELDLIITIVPFNIRFDVSESCHERSDMERPLQSDPNLPFLFYLSPGTNRTLCWSIWSSFYLPN